MVDKTPEATMYPQRFLPLALATVLSTAMFAAMAQPVDPAVVPEAETPQATDDLDVDRRCLEYTGSRVSADPQPATRRDQSERAGHDCTIGNGTVHTREDIDRTGATTVKEALQALDPRFF